MTRDSFTNLQRVQSKQLSQSDLQKFTRNDSNSLTSPISTVHELVSPSASLQSPTYLSPQPTPNLVTGLQQTHHNTHIDSLSSFPFCGEPQENITGFASMALPTTSPACYSSNLKTPPSCDTGIEHCRRNQLAVNSTCAPNTPGNGETSGQLWARNFNSYESYPASKTAMAADVSSQCHLNLPPRHHAAHGSTKVDGVSSQYYQQRRLSDCNAEVPYHSFGGYTYQ